MTDRPMLFSAPMIRALIREAESSGTGKTQTRRVIKPRGRFSLFDDGWTDDYVLDPGNAAWRERDLPCAAGDRLWVKEGFALNGDNPDDFPGHHPDLRIPVYFRADDACPEFLKWRSPIFLPRRYSRLTLIVTDVRVQRLQDISEADAAAEGAVCTSCANVVAASHGFASYLSGFGILWNQIHGEGAWDRNPWVAAITFRPALANIDAVRVAPNPAPHPAEQEA